MKHPENARTDRLSLLASTDAQQSTQNEHTTFPLDEGTAVLSWPKGLSKESFIDLTAWIEVALRKIARSSGAKYPEDSD